MKVVFFTFVSDSYYPLVGTEKMINSFKRFHPDIDLVVFRQDMIDKVFKEKNVNFYNAKPTFAKLLTPYYDLVVNIDADSVVLGRCEAILKGDYDVMAAWNYNDYENMSLENVNDRMFLNAGLVGAKNELFWDIWEEENKKAMKYLAQENSILNLVWYNNPEVKEMKRVIIDKDKDYYGCKSLNREGEFYLKDNKVMCRKEQVFIYHHAKGGRALPKLQFEKMGFTTEVASYMYAISMYGKSVRYSAF